MVKKHLKTYKSTTFEENNINTTITMKLKAEGQFYCIFVLYCIVEGAQFK